MAIEYRPISQQQYQAARLAAQVSTPRGTRIVVTSTLRDRTPAPQEKPLDEGQVIWGGPSQFEWGSRPALAAGPTINTSYNFNWPDYGLDDPTSSDPPDADYEDGETQSLPPKVYQWKEVGRVEQRVRITGTGGSYIDVDRMETVIFQLPTAADGASQFAILKFAE